jgi:hypothetical protein
MTGRACVGPGRGPGDGAPGQLTVCPVPDCGTSIDSSRLACRACWTRIPAELRAQVWITWKSGAGSGTDAHTRAIRAAISAATPPTSHAG